MSIPSIFILDSLGLLHAISLEEKKILKPVLIPHWGFTLKTNFYDSFKIQSSVYSFKNINLVVGEYKGSIELLNGFSGSLTSVVLKHSQFSDLEQNFRKISFF